MPTYAEPLEVRVLDGPNLYFPRPAVKLTLAIPGWLRATTDGLQGRSRRAGMPETMYPGERGSEQRRRFTARFAAHVARSVASATGTRLAVRGRAGPESDQIVVAFPWRRRGSAEAFAQEIAAIMNDLLATRRTLGRLAVEAAGRIQAVDPGEGPSVPDPAIPVIAVTGTNGKTTTVRLLAHIVRTAGRSVAYSSTDGVYRDGALVESGDYSGFAGADSALAQPGVDVAVLETARGGILLRGIGTAHNDVAVVTNVSSDHLGLHGIHTLEQLAEVKATITRITRPDGWDVLNADDPRVLAMRRHARGRPFLFTLDAHHPAIREVLSERGRAVTVLDRSIVLFERRNAVHRLIDLEEVPVTLAGISRHHIENALAATAASFGIGLPEDAVVRGLRSFVTNPDTNPGRANLFTLDGRIIVIDYAHNEAGMVGLTEILAGLRRGRAAVWLAFGTAGDRSDQILHALGYRAARGADHVIVAELEHYLRGRDPQDLVRRLRAGAEDGGATEVPIMPDEVRALEWMLERSVGHDVVAITALSQRPEVFGLLEDRGAVRAGPETVRTLVRAARR